MIYFYFQGSARLLLLIACFQIACTASLFHDHDDINDTNGQKLATTEIEEEVSLDNVLKTLRAAAKQAEEKFEDLKYDSFLSQIENIKKNKGNFLEDIDNKYEQRTHKRFRRATDFELRQSIMLRVIRKHYGNDAECTVLGTCIGSVTKTEYKGLHRCCQLYKVKCQNCYSVCQKLYDDRKSLEQQ